MLSNSCDISTSFGRAWSTWCEFGHFQRVFDQRLGGARPSLARFWPLACEFGRFWVDLGHETWGARRWRIDGTHSLGGSSSRGSQRRGEAKSRAFESGGRRRRRRRRGPCGRDVVTERTPRWQQNAVSQPWRALGPACRVPCASSHATAPRGHNSPKRMQWMCLDGKVVPLHAGQPMAAVMKRPDAF